MFGWNCLLARNSLSSEEAFDILRNERHVLEIAFSRKVEWIRLGLYARLSVFNSANISGCQNPRLEWMGTVAGELVGWGTTSYSPTSLANQRSERESASQSQTGNWLTSDVGLPWVQGGIAWHRCLCHMSRPWLSVHEGIWFGVFFVVVFFNRTLTDEDICSMKKKNGMASKSIRWLGRLCINGCFWSPAGEQCSRSKAGCVDNVEMRRAWIKKTIHKYSRSNVPWKERDIESWNMQRIHHGRWINRWMNHSYNPLLPSLPIPPSQPTVPRPTLCMGPKRVIRDYKNCNWVINAGNPTANLWIHERKSFRCGQALR